MFGLEGCDITGVKNALNKIKGVSDVVHETGSKRFQVWCIENIENNVLIDQVDGLTGFDATIVVVKKKFKHIYNRQEKINFV